MIHIIKSDSGFDIYDFDQYKSVSFIYGGNLVYFVSAEIYSSGVLLSDLNLSFDIDTSNMGVYSCIKNLFDSVKRINLELRSGKKKICYPPYLNGTICHNPYDTNEIYDVDRNMVVWASEAGNSMMNLDAMTIMTIEEKEDKYRLCFINEKLAKINARYPRSVCICNSGSRSDIFPSLFWTFYNDLKKIPETINENEIAIKQLRR